MRWLAGILIVLVAALFCKAQGTQEKQQLPNYYPLNPGTSWTYALELGNGKKVEMGNRIAKTEVIDGKSMARLEALVNGSVVSTEHLVRTPEGVFRCRDHGIEVVPPVCILKYPLTEGTRWVLTTTIAGQTVEMKLQVGRVEEITTPAGKFSAVPVSAESTVAGVKVESKSWYAANVGMVKQENVTTGQRSKLELVKFEAGR